jgi:TPR repeat protein
MKYPALICLSLAFAMPSPVGVQASGLADSPRTLTLNQDAGNGADDLKKLLALAATGQARAQYLIGVRYQEGNGVVQDFAMAANWYRKAAEQKYPNALYNLGHYYYNGKGVN